VERMGAAAWCRGLVRGVRRVCEASGPRDRSGWNFGYDRPMRRDPLLWFAGAVAVGVVGFQLATGSNWYILSGVLVVPLWVGVLLGSVRNFWRGLREPSRRRRKTKAGADSP
jgi:hypothetical protein